jgi:hydroxyethylthiazole kinase-like uncharacterized protein yjeF
VKRLLTGLEMRAVDAEAAALGMPGSILMENAGAALATRAMGLATDGGRFVVLCGLGNNGGDGLVAARRLAAAGRVVHVELVGGENDALRGEPARNWAALEWTHVQRGPVPDSAQPRAGDVVVDALFGTGLSRPPSGEFARAVERINAWRRDGVQVVAADLPSGLASDLGYAFEPAVEADVTLSFGFLKLGQALEPGASRCGRLELVNIGIPDAASRVLTGPATWLLEEADAVRRLPARRCDTHKGSFGHVLVVAGSPGKTGAAALAGLGALRGGAGLVTVGTSGQALPEVLRHAPELMGSSLGEGPALGLAELPALLRSTEGKQAVVIGPGLGRGSETSALLEQWLERVTVPTVLDADALTALGQDVSLLRRCNAPLVLTPHPGEMARLLGLVSAQVQSDRIKVARGFATSTGVTLVLKGARTLVASPDGTVYVNSTGNSGMATGGSGDVLAGLVGALLAQGLSAEDAAIVAVHAHGLAGDRMLQRRGLLGLIASDLLEGLGLVWSSWSR